MTPPSDRQALIAALREASAANDCWIYDSGMLRAAADALEAAEQGIAELSREYHAAIHESEYAGTREDWRWRAYHAESHVAALTVQLAQVREALEAIVRLEPGEHLAVEDAGNAYLVARDIATITLAPPAPSTGEPR